jgi:hypothetical protein
MCYVDFSIILYIVRAVVTHDTELWLSVLGIDGF